MGFPVEAFTSALDDEFICAVCMEVMEKPLMIESCEHIFCEECLEGCRKSNGKCPLDRTSISGVRAPHRSYVNTIGRLRIKCKFSDLDCSHIDNLSDIRKHEELCSHKKAIKDDSITLDGTVTLKKIKPDQEPGAVHPHWHESRAGETGASYVYIKTLLNDKYKECAKQRATIARLTLELKSRPASGKGVSVMELDRLKTDVLFWRQAFETAMEESIPTKSKILLQISNIANIQEGGIVSDVKYVRGLPYCIVATLTPQKALGVYLRCNGKFGIPDWSCSVVATLKVLSSRPDGEYRSGNIYHTFHAKETDKGFPEFIEWTTLTNPVNGFKMNNSVFVQADLQAEKPRGMG